MSAQSKYSYSIEAYRGEWIKIIRGSMQYLTGYLDARAQSSPRLPYRIVRSDGKIIRELPGRDDVSIGMVAGFPTPEQYERAASNALEKARVIRAHIKT